MKEPTQLLGWLRQLPCEFQFPVRVKKLVTLFLRQLSPFNHVKFPILGCTDGKVGSAKV